MADEDKKISSEASATSERKDKTTTTEQPTSTSRSKTKTKTVTPTPAGDSESTKTIDTVNLDETTTPKTGASASIKGDEITTPKVEEREAEHKDLEKLVSQYETMGEEMTTPITVDADKVKINPFDDTKEQEQNERDQQTEFEWTKYYMDNQVLSASSALRINSVADLGSQVKMNYEVLMPVQYQLQQAQDHYQYLNDQVNNSRQLAQIALKQQQASAVVSVQQLNQKLNLELDASRQNMESQITTMLDVYNQYESSLNNLVLSKNNIANQQKIIENKKQNSHKSWMAGLTQALPGIIMGAMIGGSALKGIGKLGKFALAEGETGGLAAKLSFTAEQEGVGAVKSGFSQLGARVLGGKASSRTIGGLIGGAVSLGMFFM